MDKPAQRSLKRLSRGLVCTREDRERLLKDAVAMLELKPRRFFIRTMWTPLALLRSLPLR